MSRVRCDYREVIETVLDALHADGVLLVTADGNEVNAMTVGWGAIGPIWGRPVAIVLVRPSRYSFGLLEPSGAFTLNVLAKGRSDELTFCGTASGRDHDKLAELSLAVSRGHTVETPSIDDAEVVLECRVRHRNDVVPDALDPTIAASSYKDDDHHRIYFGEILAAFRSKSLPGPAR